MYIRNEHGERLFIPEAHRAKVKYLLSQDKHSEIDSFATGGEVDPPLKRQVVRVRGKKILLEDSKVPIPVDPAIEEARKFTMDYINSPNYRKRLIRSGYEDIDSEIKNRIEDVKNTTVFDQHVFPSDRQLTKQYLAGQMTTGTGSKSYGFMGEGQILLDREQVKRLKGTSSSVMTHEFSHRETDANGQRINKEDREQLVNRLVDPSTGKVYNPNLDDHDIAPEENKADLNAVRHYLKKQGVDVFTKDIEAKDLEKVKQSKEFINKRLLENYTPENALWLLNNVAENKPVEDNGIRAFASGGTIEPPEKTYDGGTLPEFEVKAKDERPYLRKLAGNIAKHHANDSFLDVAVSPITYTLEALQRMGTSIFTGKPELPSEALARTGLKKFAQRNPQNPIAQIVANSTVQNTVLDPTNLIGAGAIMKPLKRIKNLEKTLLEKKAYKGMSEGLEDMRQVVRTPEFEKRISSTKGLDSGIVTSMGDVIPNKVGTDVFDANRNTPDLVRKRLDVDTKITKDGITDASLGSMGERDAVAVNTAQKKDDYIRNIMGYSKDTEILRRNQNRFKTIGVHEATHAASHGNYYLNPLEKKMLTKPFQQWEEYIASNQNRGVDHLLGDYQQHAYLTDPTEIHARINEIRHYLNPKVADRYKPIEDVDHLYKEIIKGVKKDKLGHDIPALLNLVHPERKEALKDLFNSMWGVGGITATGVALKDKK